MSGEGETSTGVEEQNVLAEALHDASAATRQNDLCRTVSNKR